jgi:type I restriction enzyme M protein
LQGEAAGGARWVRRITRHSWALYLPETARFEYLIDRPEAEDIGGAINAAMKAIADENEELGGALPRKYNSLEKPILREVLKILNRIPRANITEDAFWEIYQYFLGNLAQKEGHKSGDAFFTFISPIKLIIDVTEPNYGRILDPACGAGGMLVSTGSRKISVNKKELRESISRNFRFD